MAIVAHLPKGIAHNITQAQAECLQCKYIRHLQTQNEVTARDVGEARHGAMWVNAGNLCPSGNSGGDYSLAASTRVLSIMSHSSMCALRLPAACARSPGSLDVAMFDTSRESSAIMSCRISMTARNAAGDDSRWKASAAFMSKSSGFLYMSLRTCLRRRHVLNSIIVKLFGLVFERNVHTFFFLIQVRHLLHNINKWTYSVFFCI